MTNSIYIENLKFLRARSPSDFPRLEAFLASTTGETSVGEFDQGLTIAPKEYTPKIALLYGMFSKDAIKWLTSQPVAQQIQSIYFVDNNPDTVKASLEQGDWKSYLLNPNHHFLFGMSYDQLAQSFYRSFNNPAIRNTYQACMAYGNPSLAPNEIDFYKKVGEQYQSTARHYTSSLGFIEDYMEGVRATVSNSNLIMTRPGIQDLREKSSNRPALLVGAGPSLDANMDLLKQRQDEFTIIAADASVKLLLDAGIRVDFCTSIERGNALQKEFWTGLENYTKQQLPQLVAFPVVHADSFAAFPGDIRIVYRNYAMYAGFENLVPKGIMHSFGSCLHLGLRLASWLGCPRMYLLGADCAFEQAGEGTFRSHARGLHFSEWADGHDIKWFEKNRDPAFLPYEAGTSASGKPVLTDRVYRNWQREYELEATDPKFAGKLFQCSDNCPKLEGIPYIPFNEVQTSQAGPCEDFRFPGKVQAQILPYAAWRAELKGYSDRLVELSKLLTEDPTTEEIQTVHVYLSTILNTELFFSNWVMQCSTREATDAWNFINLLDMNAELDDNDTRQVRLARYVQLIAVFIRTIGLLYKAIQDGEEAHYATATVK